MSLESIIDFPLKCSDALESESPDADLNTDAGIEIWRALYRDGPMESKGSAGHAEGTCKPCSFYCFSIKGCSMNENCQFCHQEHKSARRTRRRPKHSSSGEAANSKTSANVIGDDDLADDLADEPVKSAPKLATRSHEILAPGPLPLSSTPKMDVEAPQNSVELVAVGAANGSLDPPVDPGCTWEALRESQNPAPPTPFSDPKMHAVLESADAPSPVELKFFDSQPVTTESNFFDSQPVTKAASLHRFGSADGPYVDEAVCEEAPMPTTSKTKSRAKPPSSSSSTIFKKQRGASTAASQCPPVEPFEPTRLRSASSHEKELERNVLLLLNKMCPENLQTIVKQLGQLDVENSSDIRVVIRTMFKKALREPHYSETYAEAVSNLNELFPDFPREEDGQMESFRRTLVNVVQAEFESSPDRMSLTFEQRSSMSVEDADNELRERKSKLLANMKFIGNLVVYQLLSLTVVGWVVHDLIGVKEDIDAPPEEYVIECACELLIATGYILDSHENGSIVVSQFIARLQELVTTNRDGRLFYSKRIKFKVQDLVDQRSSGWKTKEFREKAQTLSEIRKAAENRSSNINRRSHMQPASGFAPAKPQAAQPWQPGRPPECSHPKPVPVGKVKASSFNKAHVQAIFGRYIEDREDPALVHAWRQSNPSSRDAITGVCFVLALSADMCTAAWQAERYIEGLFVLVAHCAISDEVLKQGFSAFMTYLEGILPDTTAAKGIVSQFAAAVYSPQQEVAQVDGYKGAKCDQGTPLEMCDMEGLIRALLARDHFSGLPKRELRC